MHQKLIEKEHEHVKLPWWKACGDVWPKPRLMRPEHLGQKYETERDMTWSELFFDLIFVTATARLGEQLRESGDYVSYVIYFYVIWSCWVSSVGYSTRFGSDDLPNKLFFASYMLGVIGMTGHLQDGFSGDNCPYFAGCALFTDSLMIIMYLRVIYHMTGPARGYSAYTALYLAGRALSWVTLFFLPPEYRIYAFFGVVFFSQIHMISVLIKPCLWTATSKPEGAWYDRKLCCNHSIVLPNGFMPLHLEHFTERVGLLTIIYLGETVDDLTQPVTTHTMYYYLLLLFGFLTILSLKFIYFDAAVGDVNLHALRRHRLSGMTWYYSHVPLSCGICLLGSGINLVCSAAQREKHLVGEELGESAGRMLCSVGFSLTIFSNLLIAIAHQREWHKSMEERVYYWRSLRRVFVLQVAASFLVIFASLSLTFLFNNESWLTDMVLMGIHAGCGLLLTCLNFLDKVVEMRHCGAEDTTELENLVEETEEEEEEEESAEETTSLLAAEGELLTVTEGGEGLEGVLRGVVDGFSGHTLDSSTKETLFIALIGAVREKLTLPPPPPPPSDGYLQPAIPLVIHPVDPPRRASRAMRNSRTSQGGHAHLHGLHFVAPHADGRRNSGAQGRSRRRFSQPLLPKNSSVNFM